MNIFLAGAAGAVGKPLTQMLVAAGHRVTATTRSQAKADMLRALGAEPVVLDVFDAAALRQAVVGAQPDVVIHQLTDLPPALDPALMADALLRNARLRDEGTRNLIDAALAAGVQRMVAQSIAWTYAPGPEPHGEDDPLATPAQGTKGASMRGVIALETLVLQTPKITGWVLRYGQLYGPGTGRDKPEGNMPLHVDAAAHAALLAIDSGLPGAYNIAEPNAVIKTAKAQRELGWRADFRLAA
jgi:nucleoside-diphosphate-sugar epimerase